MKALRLLTLCLSLTLLVIGYFILNADLWFGANSELSAMFQSWVCLFPALCTLRWPPLFGFVVSLIVIALCLNHLTLEHSLARASDPQAVWAWDNLRALPLTLDFQKANARRGFRLLWLVALICTSALSALSLNPGNPPLWLWALTLSSVALLWHYADRAALRQAVLIRTEWLCLLAYTVGLLALGFAYREPLTRWLALGAVFVIAAWLAYRRPVWREAIILSVIIAVAFAIYTFDLMSWRYAFVGDEYSFYEFANNIINAQDQPYPLRMRGAYDVHPVSATLTQVATILLYGNDVYGWRISETLAIMLAALPLYVFMRSFLSVRLALLGLIVYLSSHHLLGLSKVGYTYSQLLLPITAGLALAALALRRGSLLGVFLCGLAAAWAFYTFAFGVPFIALPLLLLGLFILKPTQNAQTSETTNPSRKHNQRFAAFLIQTYKHSLPALAAFTLGVGLTAMPSLSDAEGLRQISLHTVVKTEVKAANNFTEQMLPNFLYTLTASWTFYGKSHYVTAAHLDPLSATLLMLGIGTLLASLLQRRLAWWLLGCLVLVSFFIGGLAPYPYPPIARTYILAPFYVLIVAIGGARLLHGLAQLTSNRWLANGVWLSALCAIPALNAYHFFYLSPFIHPQENMSLLVREFQAQRDAQAFYLAARAPFNHVAARMVLKSYNLDANRLLILPDADPTPAIAAIQRSRKPYIVLVSWTLPTRDRWRTAMRTPNSDGNELFVTDDVGLTHFAKYVFADGADAQSAQKSPPATPSVPSSAPFVVSEHSAISVARIVGQWSASHPRDVAVGPDGLAYVLNGERKQVEVYNLDGRLMRTLSGNWREPFALTFDARGDLLLLDSGSPAGIVRLRSDGSVSARSSPDLGLSSPRGLTTAPDGAVYIADTGAGRIVRLNAALLEPTTLSLSLALKQPTSLTFVGGQLVVADAPNIYVLNAEGILQNQWTTTMFNTTQPPRFLHHQTQFVIMTDPEPGLVLLFDLNGRKAQTFGPPLYERLRKPLGIAATPNGKVLIADEEGNLVRVMDWGLP